MEEIAYQTQEQENQNWNEGSADARSRPKGPKRVFVEVLNGPANYPRSGSALSSS